MQVSASAMRGNEIRDRGREPIPFTCGQPQFELHYGDYVKGGDVRIVSLDTATLDKLADELRRKEGGK